MADCPKCGFTQPDDQYCANCGVDMHGYLPAPTPLWKKLSHNTGVQVLALAFVLIALFSFIYISQRELIEAQLKKALAPTVSDLSPEEKAEAPVAPTPKALTATPATITNSRIEETQPNTPAPEESIPTTIQAIQLAYAEVPIPLLQSWAEEGQILNEAGHTRSILIQQKGPLSQLKRQDWQPYFLAGEQSFKPVANQTHTVNFLKLPSGWESEIGLVLDIIPKGLTADMAKFNLQAMLQLPSDMSESIDSETVNAEYEIPRHSVLILVGLVTPTRLSEAATAALNGTPLSIMQSPEFMSGATDFALIIQVE